MKAYAAGGSSNTPADVLELMFKFAGVMSDKGITLRCSESGIADETFVKGCKGKFFTYIPHGCIDESLDNPDAKPYKPSVWGITSDLSPGSSDVAFARSLDPSFLMLSTAEKQWEVVANSLIYGLPVLGKHQSLAKMLVCWSESGDHVERYIRKAVKAGVMVLNLAIPQDRKKVESWTR